MSTATFRFHDSLNFFLPRKRKHKTITHPFDWRGSIKDMIESLGVPHPEIELLLVNGQAVDFDYIVQSDDVIDVYPDFEAVEANGKVRLAPPYPGKPRFVLDTHLGRLAAYLRLLGFDTLYRNDYPDDELARVSHDEQRILLTRDTGLLKRSLVIYGYYVRNTDPKARLKEIIARYDLLEHAEPFRYCMKCNGRLEAVEKAEVLDELPPRTAQHFDDFYRCRACGQIYWKGSHYERLLRFIEDVVNGPLKL